MNTDDQLSILELLRIRRIFRDNKQYSKADEIREFLSTLDVTVIDFPDGTWTYKRY